ncbi:phosphoribosyltransferase [Pseudoduganella sp. LjRoot289]|uniref:phosphoribosyltransferase n=1 Tax=Pseudoduganella sp. LjRoot289 TaxID=3342314 RepID=UPI003ECEFBFF
MAKLERFENRLDAGVQLAQRLSHYAGRTDVTVLALPRGGVPVGFAVARALQVPLDILLVRKLGVPGHEEYAFGAVASGGLYVVQKDVVDTLEIAPPVVELIVQRELKEIERREKLYRAGLAPPQLRGRVAILVDDGLATGSTMLAAVHVLRLAQPARMVAAAPVAAPDACRELAAEVDEMLCVRTPDPFYAVGLWYKDFDQTSDAEVGDLLEQARYAQQRRARLSRPAAAAAPASHGGRHDIGAQ